MTIIDEPGSAISNGWKRREREPMKTRAVLAAGALLAGVIGPVIMTQAASASEDESTICLVAANLNGGCIDQPPGSTSELQIDNGSQYYVATEGTVSNQFTNDRLNVDYKGDRIVELFNDPNHDRCIRVNASAPDQPVLGSPGAACEFVMGDNLNGSPNVYNTRLVSIGSSNDNGGSSPYYLQTRSLAKGTYISTDTVTNGRYTKWDTWMQ
jgi:hypothetical protein